jgi:serine/threonine protein kinase
MESDKTLPQIEINEAHSVPYNQVLKGRYKLLSPIGEGSNGVLFKAIELNTGKTVAIKFLRMGNLSKEDLLRFNSEAQLLSVLSHSNIVCLIDYGRDDNGSPFIVMNYVEGSTLKSLLEEKGILGREEFLDIFLQLCEGLSHAHEHGIIHRDLKPSNIMVSFEPDGRRKVRIIDFGIARYCCADSRITRTGYLVGSPAYMSPEQARSSSVDCRSDIYSLGCVMYEALSGSLPFEAENALETMVKRLHEDPLPMQAGGLEQIVMRILQRDPELRFQNVQELKTALLNTCSHNLAPPEKRQRKLAAPTRMKAVVVVSLLIALATIAYL